MLLPSRLRLVVLALLLWSLGCNGPLIQPSCNLPQCRSDGGSGTPGVVIDGETWLAIGDAKIAPAAESTLITSIKPRQCQKIRLRLPNGIDVQKIRITDVLGGVQEIKGLFDPADPIEIAGTLGNRAIREIELAHAGTTTETTTTADNQPATATRQSARAKAPTIVVVAVYTDDGWTTEIDGNRWDGLAVGRFAISRTNERIRAIIPHSYQRIRLWMGPGRVEVSAVEFSTTSETHKVAYGVEGDPFSRIVDGFTHEFDLTEIAQKFRKSPRQIQQITVHYTVRVPTSSADDDTFPVAIFGRR